MAALLNEAIAQITYESKVAAVDNLESHMAQKVEIDNDMKEIFTSFKEQLKTEYEESKKASKKGKKGAKGGASDVPKQKKAPTAYNIFIKEKIAEIKAQNPDLKNGKELLKMATEAWKSRPAA